MSTLERPLDHPTSPDPTRSAASADAARPTTALILVGLSMLGTALLPVLAHVVATTVLVVVGSVVALVTVALMVGVRGSSSHTPGLHRRLDLPATARSSGRMAWELALHLSPVILLTAAYPLAAQRIVGVQIGGVDLMTLLLASSVTVPWLTQSGCLPIYRVVGPLLPVQSDEDLDRVKAAFLRFWPGAFVQALPVVALFAVLVESVLRLPLAALAVYVGLCLAHLAFVQALVVVNAGRRRGLWALSWAAYAAALLAAPALWFLPPLVATLVACWSLRGALTPARESLGVRTLPMREVAVDLLRGLLLGSVLWADKVFVFLAGGGQFAVQTVFLALMPAVIAYNFYFVRLAPRFDRGVLDLRDAMESLPASRLTGVSAGLVGTVVATVARAALVGALLTIALTAVVVALDPADAVLSATVSVASWLFLVITLLAYKLDYIGERVRAQVISGAHLLIAVLAFTLFSGTASYAVLALGDTLVLALALHQARDRWRSPEFTLFWRHATGW